MTRRIADAILLVLCLCVAPPVARGPAPPAPGWDPFAAAALLESLPAALVRSAFEPDLAAPASEPALYAAPEPAALPLLAWLLLALARPQRARAASHSSATSRGDRPR